MKSSRTGVLVAVAALVASVADLAYRVGRARADGVPAHGAMFYSGVIEESGAPVDGARDLVVQVWSDATSTSPGALRCTTTMPATPVAAGRFRIALDDACADAVHATPDLWIEVAVNGTSQGRSKLGAVPYALEAARAADLTSAVRNQLAPPGSVVAFAGVTAPPGWLVCDGSTVSRGMYPALFAAIGTAHGRGDGSTTFNLPDLRGRFLRGLDRGTGRDPGAATRTAENPGGNTGNLVGAFEPADLLGHVHPFTTGGESAAHVHAGTTDGGGPCNVAQTLAGMYNDYSGASPGFIAHTFTGPCPHTHTFTTGAPSATHTHSGTTASAGGAETRPANVAIDWVIKF